MKAIVYARYGSPDVCATPTSTRRAVKADEVLVRVRAASVNRGDRFAMYGEPRT